MSDVGLILSYAILCPLITISQPWLHSQVHLALNCTCVICLSISYIGGTFTLATGVSYMSVTNISRLLMAFQPVGLSTCTRPLVSVSFGHTACLVWLNRWLHWQENKNHESARKVKVIVGEGTVIPLYITHYANCGAHWEALWRLDISDWLTFFSADTDAIVKDQVFIGQLCHHAGSFEERLKQKTVMFPLMSFQR